MLTTVADGHKFLAGWLGFNSAFNTIQDIYRAFKVKKFRR